MIFEYSKLLNAEFASLSFEFIAHVCLLLFGGLLLALIGYRIKGMLGSALVLVIGSALFLHHAGLLRF